MRQLDGGRLRNPHAQEDVLSTRPPEANAPNPREAQSASARFHLAMKDLGMARPAAPGTLVQEALCTAPTWITPPAPSPREVDGFAAARAVGTKQLLAS